MRGYGIAASDAEGSWDSAFKLKLKKVAIKTVMKQITFLQKIQVLIWFYKEKKRAAKLDLSGIRAKGMRNEVFIKQQLEYVSLFSALTKVLNQERALKIMYSVMDVTAVEALLLSLPEIDEVKKFGDSLEFFRKYMVSGMIAANKAGCHEITTTEDSTANIRFNINWCVWFELAKKMDVPEACLANCYADDLVYPHYFKALGIKYSREGTLAQGKKCCDIRFEKI